MALPALVTVNGKALPEPSTYDATTSTFVDAGRNVEGRTVGAVIRHDVAKIDLTWRYLTAQQWADVIGPFNTNFYCEVRFLDQSTNRYTTRTMYVSDRTASGWRRNPASGEMMGYLNCRLALIET